MQLPNCFANPTQTIDNEQVATFINLQKVNKYYINYLKTANGLKISLMINLILFIDYTSSG